MKIKLMLIITFLKTLFIFCQTSDVTQLDTLRIPVIFHINHSAKLSLNQKNQFENSLDKLVLDFNNRINLVDYNNLNNRFSEIALSPNIKLYRPDCDLENKSIKNIFWYKKSKIKNNIHIPILDDIFLRLKSKDKNYFLNIWIVDLFDLGIQSNFCDIDATIKDIGGYTPSKFHIADGIVLDSDNMDYTFSDPYLFIHEFGHYLGLRHIWGNINGCQYDDGIIDTPPQKEAHDLNNLIVQESCNGGKTNHQNFMDYSYDTGMFTEDQVEVMRNNLKTKRAGLLWKPDCINSTKSVLSNAKQRNKLGSPFNFNQRLPFNTNVDLTLKALIEKELKVVFSTDNINKLGLELIGTDKFKDLHTRKTVSQDYIYHYLDLDNAKAIISKNSTFEPHVINKIIQYYDVKKRKYIYESELRKELVPNEFEAMNSVSENLVIFPYYTNMTYEIYKNGSLISVKNLSTNKYVKEINLEAGSYRIICKVQSTYLGQGYKDVSYTKELADISFEHLGNNSDRTILIIRGDNKNIIYNKVKN